MVYGLDRKQQAGKFIYGTGMRKVDFEERMGIDQSVYQLLN
jgi:hypothetical protein